MVRHRSGSSAYSGGGSSRRSRRRKRRRRRSRYMNMTSRAESQPRQRASRGVVAQHDSLTFTHSQSRVGTTTGVRQDVRVLVPLRTAGEGSHRRLSAPIHLHHLAYLTWPSAWARHLPPHRAAVCTTRPPHSDVTWTSRGPRAWLRSRGIQPGSRPQRARLSPLRTFIYTYRYTKSVRMPRVMR